MKSTKKRSSFSMQETDEAEEENEDLSDRQKQIREGGAVVTKNRKHTIQCLTVIGQIEGHYVAPSQNKTTKYEHVIPQIVSVEEDPNIDGLLMILNTVGGDVEAGLAIAELVAGMRKPTVSLVLGGGHSIGVPLAVAAKHSFIGIHDHSPGAHERPDAWRAADAGVFPAHAGPHYEFRHGKFRHFL